MKQLGASIDVIFKFLRHPGTWAVVGGAARFSREEKFPQETDCQPKRLLENFLDIPKGDGHALLRFLRRNGRWSGLGGHIIPLADFWHEQERLRQTIVNLEKPSKRRKAFGELQSALDLGPQMLQVDPGKPFYLTVWVQGTREIIYAWLFKRVSEGARFMFCKRPNCPYGHKVGEVPFTPETPYRTHYCSEECAHAVAQMSYRKRKTKTAKRR